MSEAGQAALVTGAQQGIGAAVARALAADGLHVVINYLDDMAQAQGVLDAIENAGGQGSLCQGDVSSSDDARRMAHQAEQAGGLRVVVNNAGIFPRVSFLDMTEIQWDAVLNVNLRGTFLVTQASCRLMVGASRAGAVVNLSSVAANSGPPLGAHYAATKAGILGFTRATAVAMAPHGIRVNAVAPGLTDTAQPRYGMTEDEIAEAGARLPAGHIATPDDIASTVAFLAGDASRHVTGQVLHVNGGQLML